MANSQAGSDPHKPAKGRLTGKDPPASDVGARVGMGLGWTGAKRLESRGEPFAFYGTEKNLVALDPPLRIVCEMQNQNWWGADLLHEDSRAPFFMSLFRKDHLFHSVAVCN